jgi:exonuclease III
MIFMGNQISNSNVNYSLNSTNLDCTKRNASNKLSDLLIYHYNIRGINDNIEELLTQWESNQPHILCFKEHHLTEPEMTNTVIKSYNLRTYFCRKFKKNCGLSIFILQNLQFTHIDLDEFCTDQEIEICAVKLHNFSTNICILTVYRSPTGNFLHFF